MTTNYDPGIVDARMRVRPAASATGFLTWRDELGLDEWRTGDVFGEIELPVLYAHGQHNQPDSIVLASTEYRRAYEGKLPHVLRRLVDGGRLGVDRVQLRRPADHRDPARDRGTAPAPGSIPGPRPGTSRSCRGDPAAAGNDPRVLAPPRGDRLRRSWILYPAPGGDHAALAGLSGLTDERFRAAAGLPARTGARARTPGPPSAPGAPRSRWR